MSYRNSSSVHQLMSKEEVVCVFVSVCVMQYYSAIKKGEILPFPTMWRELEGITLSKTSLRTTNTI